jgi:hypothetical protein
VCNLIETAAFVTARDSGSSAGAVATTDSVDTAPQQHQLHDEANTQLVSDLQVRHATLLLVHAQQYKLC